MKINWDDPEAKVSRHFTVRDAIWLPQWNRYAVEADGLDGHAKLALERIFDRLDLVRDLLGVPLVIHCAFRPLKYNQLVRGSATSAHVARMWQGGHIAAVDFSPQGMSCDAARELIEPELAPINIRMENLPGSDWIHIDNRPHGPSGRYFAP